MELYFAENENISHDLYKKIEEVLKDNINFKKIKLGFNKTSVEDMDVECIIRGLRL
jgi:hypothetical protein